jgi:hypothetical protein
MTETVLSPDMLKLLKPELVTPIVTYLVHEQTKISGSCFEVGGGWYSQVRLQRSAGRFLANDSSAVSAEDILNNMKSIQDFSESDNPVNLMDSFTALSRAKGMLLIFFSLLLKKLETDLWYWKIDRKGSEATTTDNKSPPSTTTTTTVPSTTENVTTTSPKDFPPAKSDIVFEHLKKFLAQW